jgi:hypothetical protein
LIFLLNFFCSVKFLKILTSLLEYRRGADFLFERSCVCSDFFCSQHSIDAVRASICRLWVQWQQQQQQQQRHDRVEDPVSSDFASSVAAGPDASSSDTPIACSLAYSVTCSVTCSATFSIPFSIPCSHSSWSD